MTPRVRPGAIRVLSIPGSHPYPLRLRETVDGRADVWYRPDPPVSGADAAQWWPPPALRADWLRDHAGEVDIVHLHFGFDDRTPDQLADWCAVLDGAGIPLVLTVHDLVNPHFVDQTEHLRRLAVLVPQAAELVTLTPGAAREIECRFGRAAAVVAHPHVAPLERVGRPASRPRDRFRVGLHLKSLRANVVATPVVRAVVAAAEPWADTEVKVHLHREVLDPHHPRHDASLLAMLTALHGAGRITLTVHDPHTDAELWSYLRDLDLSVMPYAFGTHSGWLEACFDLGTGVLAPRTGYWTEQQQCATYGWSIDGPSATEIRTEMVRCRDERPARQATRDYRRAQQQEIATWHTRLYRRLAA